MWILTWAQAVAVRHLADEGFRPVGDLIYFAVADEESGSAHGARWMAENHLDAIRADYVLTESGGIHSGFARGAGGRHDSRREGGCVAPADRAGHPGPRVNALPNRQRIGQGGGRGTANRRVRP